MTLQEIKRQWFNAESAKGHLPKVVDSAEANGIRDTMTTAWSPSKVCKGPSFAGHPGMRVTSQSSVGLAKVHTVSVSMEEAEQLGWGGD